MHIDTAELICRETFATHKPGVGFLAPDDVTGIFEPITEDQMYVRIMCRFRVICSELESIMSTWTQNPARLDDDSQAAWTLGATPEQLKVYWPWKKGKPLQDSQVLKHGAEAIRGVAFTGDDLDVEPMMLGTPSGVLDLRTGRLLPPAEAVEHLVTKRTAVDPAPVGDVNHAFTDAIISAIPAGQRAYLRWHLARGLVAEMGRKAFVHVGSGANGKSMILGLVHVALGDYSVQIDSAALTGMTADYHKALLRGARMAYMEELETETSINAAIWKMLVATPTVTARPIREAPISFPATWTVHICSNSMPTLDTGDGGAARRAGIISWPHKYVADPRADHERRINVKDVAAWGADPRNQASMLRWLLDVVNDPEPAMPDAMSDDLQDWKAGNNKVGTFVAECCIFDAGAAVTLRSLQSAYENWLFRNGFAKPNRFTREKVISAWAENERDVSKARRASGFVLVGLRLLDVADSFAITVPESAEVRAAVAAPVQTEIAHLDEWPTDEMPQLMDGEPYDDA